MINVNLDAVDPAFYELVENLKHTPGAGTLNTEVALTIGANIIKDQWKRYAMGEPIMGSLIQMKNPASRLAASIKGKKTGRFSWFVYSDSPIADLYSEDTAEKDYKRTHPYGRKSRVSKEGIPYLIVPFRHNTKSGSRAIPEPVYKGLLKAIKEGTFDKSKVDKTKAHYEENFSGKPIKRQGYQWGSRLKGLAPELKNLEGMVVMDTSTPRSRSSAYFTFRVISAKQQMTNPGAWINPERPSLTNFAIKNRIEEVLELVKYGVRQDLGI